MERALANKHWQRALAATALATISLFMLKMGHDLDNDAAAMACNTVDGHYVDDCGSMIQEYRGNSGLLTAVGQDGLLAGFMMSCLGAYKFSRQEDDAVEEGA